MRRGTLNIGSAFFAGKDSDIGLGLFGMKINALRT